MGYIDRVIRVIIAVIVAVLYFNGTLTGTVGVVLMILAIVFALTSMLSFCPLYTLFGISSQPKKKVHN